MSIEVLLLISSAGVLLCLSFALYLFSLREQTLSNQLFAFLLLAFIGRISKSVAYYFTNKNLPPIIENVGYAAQLAISPLLLFYIISITDPSFKFQRKNGI